VPRRPDSVSAAQDSPAPLSPRLVAPRPHQRAAEARRQGQARRAMRAARKEPPPPRKGCLCANHWPRPPRPPGLPRPRAPAQTAPWSRTTGHRARRPRAHDGTRRSPGLRPDLGSRPAAPLRTRCRTGPAASSDRRWDTARRHVCQASARIVPSGSRQRQPQIGILNRHAARERGGNQRLGQDHLRRRACSAAWVPHVELDALSWEANWVSVAPAVLRERVARAVAADEWVVDGNYSATRDLVWGRADTVVWLDFPFALVMWRVIVRTLRRSLRGDVLWSGNRESLLLALSRDSIILWSLTTYRRRRRDYPRLFHQYPGVRFVRLRSPTQARSFLEAIASPAPDPVSGPRSRPGRPPGDSPAGGATTSGARGRQ